MPLRFYKIEFIFKQTSAKDFWEFISYFCEETEIGGLGGKLTCGFIYLIPNPPGDDVTLYAGTAGTGYSEERKEVSNFF